MNCLFKVLEHFGLLQYPFLDNYKFCTEHLVYLAFFHPYAEVNIRSYAFNNFFRRSCAVMKPLELHLIPVIFEETWKIKLVVDFNSEVLAAHIDKPYSLYNFLHVILKFSSRVVDWFLFCLFLGHWLDNAQLSVVFLVSHSFQSL